MFQILQVFVRSYGPLKEVRRSAPALGQQHHDVMRRRRRKEEEDEQEQEQEEEEGGGGAAATAAASCCSGVIIAIAFSTCLRACLLAGGAAGRARSLNKTILTDTCSRQGAAES